MAATASLAAAFVAGFRPAPEISVSEWADRYRQVGKPSPQPGIWRTERVPYTREIMDCLSPSSPVEITILMKAAQGAGTEIAMNAMGCWMDQYPDSIMLVQPTISAAMDFSRTRIDPFIEVNPRLRSIVASKRSRAASNTGSLKEFGSGNSWFIVGANSGVGLRSNPVRYLVMDEVDGYPTDLDGEGDPTEIAIQRTGAFNNRKIFIVSTPTIKEASHIDRWHQRGDQREYFVPCPFCGHKQPWVFLPVDGKPGGLRWKWGQPETAQYECESCVRRMEEWRKVEVLQHGEWRPTFANGNPKIRSYHVNALYYPYGWPENAWENLARKWEADFKDPLKLKTFVNLKLGMPWKDPSEAKADADELLARTEVYGPEIPYDVAALTVGVDVQGNRLEAEMVGWGRDEESWSIEHVVFLGDTSKPVSTDPNRPSPWQLLDSWLKSEFLSEMGIPLHVWATCVDAGFLTQVVTAWCGERFNRKVYATVGRTGPKPVWPKKPGRSRIARAPIFVVGVDSAKEAIYARLKIQEPGPGFCHFPKSRSRDYFEQLTSEVRMPDYTRPVPTFVWKKKAAGSRNEALDIRAEAYEALCALQAAGLHLNSEVEKLHRMAAALKQAPKPADESANRFVARSSWLNR